jgi:hypothetical protein
MDAYSYQIESYTPPSGARIEKERRREEWDEYQQQRGMCPDFVTSTSRLIDERCPRKAQS